MSFLADNKSQQRFAVDGATGQEPPLKRLRSVLGADPTVGDGAALGLARAVADPLSIAAYGNSLLGADARAWPLRAGLDAQLLAASGLSGSLGSLGSLGALGSFGSLGMSSTAAAFIERNLSNLDASHAMAFKDLSLVSTAGIQLPVPNARLKTKLCKHFIENNCKFKEMCSFAHSIEELKKMPGEGDPEGKSLLERYKAKAEAEKQSSVQDASVVGAVDFKTKLCKFFIVGECKFKEGCHFAHGINELKKLPEDGDDMEKALLEWYKAKAGLSRSEPAQSVTQTESLVSTSTLVKTKLCKHFISGNCKFKESCTFAHSIGELKSLPGEGDDAGKALLELYQIKMEAEKPTLAETKETLTSGAAAIVEAVEEACVDVQTTLKCESAITTATEAKVDDKSVRLLKTKMCKHFLVGACKYNKNCTFAHAIEELKPPADPNDTQQITQPVQSSQQADGKPNEGPTQTKDDKQGLLKTKPCRFFSEGTCRFGNACAFVHSDQMHATGSNGSASERGALQGPGEIKATYKTRLCNMWERDKTCSFGAKCHFAHGAEELRQRPGPMAPATNNLTHALQLDALARAQQLALSSSGSYSYDVTDTNWRPFQGAAEILHLRNLLQNYGQLEPASSLTSLSSLGGANVGFTPNIFANLPSWPTR
ncbi:hypothetical protein GOP47_0018977 [Adiantum capillus-veneris]|uniref:C3H1-type domain-containing protein n=1 Tax=Adiantum capillus-veneris TaxID=13818 RepID=A0A9D4Z8N3_ADICA|nr:hypothetical protein GOP47_0018977 [Adiantum capillus-veneris]